LELEAFPKLPTFDFLLQNNKMQIQNLSVDLKKNVTCSKQYILFEKDIQGNIILTVVMFFILVGKWGLSGTISFVALGFFFLNFMEGFLLFILLFNLFTKGELLS
jgi:hypothetical protein